MFEISTDLIRIKNASIKHKENECQIEAFKANIH